MPHLLLFHCCLAAKGIVLTLSLPLRQDGLQLLFLQSPLPGSLLTFQNLQEQIDPLLVTHQSLRVPGLGLEFQRPLYHSDCSCAPSVLRQAGPRHNPGNYSSFYTFLGGGSAARPHAVT